MVVYLQGSFGQAWSLAAAHFFQRVSAPKAALFLFLADSTLELHASSPSWLLS
jgi:hypothetical protein